MPLVRTGSGGYAVKVHSLFRPPLWLVVRSTVKNDGPTLGVPGLEQHAGYLHQIANDHAEENDCQSHHEQ